MNRALKNTEKIYRISLIEESLNEMIAFMNNEEITYDLLKEELTIVTIVANETNRKKINHKLKQIGENNYLKYDKRLKIEWSIDNLIDEMNIIEKYDYPNDEFEHTEEQKYISDLTERIYYLEYNVSKLMEKVFPPIQEVKDANDKKDEIKIIDRKKKIRFVGW